MQLWFSGEIPSSCGLQREWRSYREKLKDVNPQTGIYTPLILSPASQPEWHDMNVVRKAAANSHHSCSSPRTCKGNVWIPGLLLDSLCHQKKKYLVSEKAWRHRVEVAVGNSWEEKDNFVSALQIIQNLLSFGCILLLLCLLFNISPKLCLLRNWILSVKCPILVAKAEPDSEFK